MKVRLSLAVYREGDDSWNRLLSKMFIVPDGICFVPGMNFGILPPVNRMNYVTFAEIQHVNYIAGEDFLRLDAKVSVIVPCWNIFLDLIENDEDWQMLF